MSTSLKQPILTDSAVRSSATEFGASVRPHDFDAWLTAARREERMRGVRYSLAQLGFPQDTSDVALQALQKLRGLGLGAGEIEARLDQAVMLEAAGVSAAAVAEFCRLKSIGVALPGSSRAAGRQR